MNQRKKISFIVRNKKLAKCGHGVLSLTDLEKQRVRQILNNSDETSNKPFMIKESQSKQISEINEKLQGLASTIDSNLDLDTPFKLEEQLKRLKELDELIQKEN